MNRPDTLTNLYSHNLWANLRLLELCSALSEEQLTATMPGAFGPILETLRHIVTAEQSYLSRISTGQPFSAFSEDMSISEMISIARQTGAGFVEWAAKVGVEDVVTLDWRGTPRAVPKTVILTQVINHATEHRAQIMAILTQIGIKPPSLDSWTYFDEMDN